jgi:DNA polymerase-1
VKSNADYKIITTEDALDWVVAELNKVDLFAFDLETSGFSWQNDKIVGWAISWKPLQGVYIPVGHTVGQQLPAQLVVDKLKPIFESTKTKCAHNVKFDSRFVWQVEIDLDPTTCEDTLIEAFVAAEGYEHFGEKELVERIFHHRMVRFDDLFPARTKVKNIATVNYEIAGEYACEDADYCLRLHLRYFDIVQTQFIYKLEKRLWPIVQKIEDTGVLADDEYLYLASRYVKYEAEKVRKIIMDQVEMAAGRRISFALNSSKQMGQVLYDILKLPAMVQTKSGANSTGELALEQLADEYPICRNILTYRSMISTAKSMGETIPSHIGGDGRIHTNYNQCGAPTGRFASSAPNLQNIGKIKEWIVILPNGDSYTVSIVPREAMTAQSGYYLIELDFKQIEFVVMAAEANDEVTLKAYLSGEDAHRANAVIMFAKPIEQITDADREATKTCAYLTIYGGSGHRLALQQRISEEEGERRLNAFFRAKPKFQIYMQMVRDRTRKTKFAITKFGRKIPIPEYFEQGRQSLSSAERKAVNCPIQGTAADIHKMGLILSTKMSEANWQFDDARMVLQTHDSQTWEVRQDISPDVIIPKLIEAMSPKLEKYNYPRIQVDAKVGITWGNLVKYKAGSDWTELFTKMEQQKSDLRDNLRTMSASLDEEDEPTPIRPDEEEQESEPTPEPQVMSWRIRFTTGRELSGNDARDMVDILKAFPGDNVIVLCLNDSREICLDKYPTSLNAKGVQEAFTILFPRGKAEVDKQTLVQAVDQIFARPIAV